MVREARDLIHVLRDRAQRDGDQRAFVFLRDGTAEDASITYAELDRQARAVAARLQALNLCGERVLLAYPPGLEFIAGLWGCLYAGCVAVPTSVAHRRRRLERFAAIVDDAQARLILSTAEAAAQFRSGEESGVGKKRAARTFQWLATDEIEDDWADRWYDAGRAPDALAMIQYTSGSTSEPKGVMLSHGNLTHNASAICAAFGVDGREAAVFWLPTYHDMGLVGGVLAPVFSAITNVMMSPTTFLQSPITWLDAISRYRATISGGPNFAYDLCARKITDEQGAALDLSSWTLAFVGAEPVQAKTLERFAEAFAGCGFRRSAFYPCFGLAESTLMVTGPERGEGAVVYSPHVPGNAQGNGRNGEALGELVSCGRPVVETCVAIVDPERRAEVAPGEIGEIWVAGPSVGLGYWSSEQATQQTFAARLADGRGPFLRTGDLGFLDGGRLFVTGRSDDLMIVRGVNRYPQDIESTAEASHPLLAHHRGACFAVTDEEGNRHVLVHEVTRDGIKDYSPVLDAACEAVLDEHEVALDAVVLVRGGTIPRTSSGKIQRNACRDAFLAEELHVVAERVATGSPASRAAFNGRAKREPRPASGEGDSAAFRAVCEHVCALGRTLPGVGDAALSPQTAVSALGLDSLQRIELVASLEKTYAARLPDTSGVQTLGELAEVVRKHLLDGPRRAVSTGVVPPEHYDLPRFPELDELRRHETMVREAAGENPFFRIDEGGTAHAGASRIDGREVINFCGYDYLGMAHDPEVAAATRAAIERYGTSAGASRLVSGEKRVHRDLERALAEFLGTPDAVVFVSGHATNVTAIGHLFGPGDLIVHDLLAHNSILQGARLSGAAARAFPHNDWEHLDRLLSEVRDRYRRVLIAIEGVYSMDGDWPDLPRFIELKKKHKALLLVDEAHSLGTMGATGHGIAERFGVSRDEADIWMGTLSKALASCGGFIAGSAELVKYLKCTAPGFVYSVGLSPPNAAAALASLTILQREPQRVADLRAKSALFLQLARERGLDTGLAAGSPVVPVIVGNSAESLRLSRALFEKGMNVQPILRPAVPEDASRLRFFITINHDERQIREAVEVVAAAQARA